MVEIIGRYQYLFAKENLKMCWIIFCKIANIDDRIIKEMLEFNIDAAAPVIKCWSLT